MLRISLNYKKPVSAVMATTLVAKFPWVTPPNPTDGSNLRLPATGSQLAPRL